MKNKSQSWGCAEGQLRHCVIFASRVGSMGVTEGEGIKRLHPDKRMCLPKGGQKGEAAPKTNRRAGLTGFYPRESHGWPKHQWDLDKISLLVVSLKDLSLTARLPMEEATLCHRMVPTWSGASSLGRMKGTHMEKKGKRKK